MKRTLITGVGGFTGLYAAATFADRGHEVHGIVHHGAAAAQIAGVRQLYEADLADHSAISRIVEEVKPDFVLHLAGIAFVAHSDVEQIYRSNVTATRQLLDALAALQRPPQSILLASSANVYGNAREGVLDETFGFAPANDYAVSKVAMEYVASLYQTRLPLIIARPFNYTGRGQSAEFIIPKIIAHAIDKCPTIELGNLDVARDFSDVRTVVDVYARLLNEPDAVGETYNVCSGRAVTIREVLETVSRISGHSFDIRVNEAFVRHNDVRVLRGSPAKLEGLIGTVEAIPLEETVQWMLEA